MPPKPASAVPDLSVIGAPSSPVRTGSQAGSSGASSSKKKKTHRGPGKKRKNRRQSFAAPSEGGDSPSPAAERPGLEDVPEAPHEQSFYRLGNRATNSNNSLESEALLDHRTQAHPRARRQSVSHQSSRPGQIHRQSTQGRPAGPTSRPSTKTRAQLLEGDSENEDEEPTNDRTPLIGGKSPGRPNVWKDNTGYGGVRDTKPSSYDKKRRQSETSSISARRVQRRNSSRSAEYDVNNPPSVPGSPRLGPSGDGFDDVMLPEFHSRSPGEARKSMSQGREAIIDIDDDSVANGFDGGPFRGTPRSPVMEREYRRRSTAADDVCVPFDVLTEAGDEEDFMHQQDHETLKPRRSSRKRQWPDLAALEEWCLEEKEERELEGVRAKRVSEPVLIGGRLRPQKGGWSRDDEEEPFRWTYFNEELDSSLRSHSLSGLEGLDYNFRQLFIPDPPELEEDSSDDEDDQSPTRLSIDRSATPVNGGSSSHGGTRQSSILDHKGFEGHAQHVHAHSSHSHKHSHDDARSKSHSRDPPQRPKRYGPRPVFWLDVLQPTYDEMRILSRVFGIHKLTAEDIMEQEAREKVELFRNYYFVNYRTFEQDPDNEEFMEPVNMYFIVFKGGVLSFHFSPMPHPANVRRRIRQLAEHQYTDSDWISYAIIDNITDAYAPVIEQIEREVDNIDDDILGMHAKNGKDADEKKRKKHADKKRKSSLMGYLGMGDNEKDNHDSEDDEPMSDTGKDMLLRVGECRKKVMSLYRLLGNKADVIKGLAKRCNEQWQVAPTSDVGLYLGDIQDHIVTMTGSLTHYENILSRAHSNYLAQLNIAMNERAEQTGDVLGKLTVLGSMVLPLNIVTGMWGMNVWVPGQGDENNLTWFYAMCAFFALFVLVTWFVAKRVYHLV